MSYYFHTEQYIDNNLFSRHFLTGDFDTLFADNRYQSAFEQLLPLFDPDKWATLNEAQLEEEWVKPVLHALGFSYAYQVSKKTQGRNIKPDFALFANDAAKDAHYAADKATNETILALCESKAYHVILDSKKIDTERNPHFQLMDYLNSLRCDIGFLTNGKLWRFYNTHQNRADKVFYQIDIEAIFAARDVEAFRYFYDIFRVENFLAVADATTNQLIQRNDAAKERVEADLRQVIYGKESIVEAFGQYLHQRNRNLSADYDLRATYENSVIFVFRLLFIAYFEDKFSDVLFKQHPYYVSESLHRLAKRLLDGGDADRHYPDEGFNGWGELQRLFVLLDRGDENTDIPLLNGGLFAPDKAPMLTMTRVIPNKALKVIWRRLLYGVGSSEQQMRDFKTLSVQHLGNIYEGLLEFEFREVLDADVHYLIYTESKKEIEGYFDNYDYKLFCANKKIEILYQQRYASGEVYFSDKSSNRKTTASYYTPPAFTEFMAQSALQHTLTQHNNILQMRFLDNACGSGHFLIELLQVITNHAYQHLHEADQTELRQTFETERQAVLASIHTYFGDKVELDELTLLKRLLLKKTIFGVDLNAFAVELTRLSLWLDTFIIGTPLSFIEHHIKRGNALIGSTRQQLLDAIPDTELFKEVFRSDIESLTNQLNQLSNLRDNTPAEVARSKAIYEQLLPTLNYLNRALHLITFRAFIPIEYTDKAVAKHWQTEVGAAFGDMKRTLNNPQSALMQEVNNIAKKYSFFNYEIEFADVFAGDSCGYDGIIGNPPWDKTKFADDEFFATYRSSYRTLPHSQKKEIRDTVLEYAGVRQEYELRRDWVVKSNEYFKLHFPYNRGAGDNNLFRLFIENNLRLLKPAEGALTYLTPSAWIYEDSSLNLRKHILEQYQLQFFYQFENREAIFPRVDSRYKFSTFQLAQRTDQTELESVRTRFMQTDVAILATNEDILYYPTADIRTLSPLHWAFFEVKSMRDLDILRKAYALFAPLNAEYMDFKNELHMTNDRTIFREQQTNANDWTLYEGKMIHQFDSLFAAPTYWVQSDDLRNALKSVEISRMIDAVYDQMPFMERAELEGRHKTKEKTVLAYLGLNQRVDLEQFVKFDFEYLRLAYRSIARNTDERTLITSLIPAYSTLGNSMAASVAKKYVLVDKTVLVEPIPLARALFINAICNSMVVDFILRFLVDINVNKTYLMRLPIPQPTDAELMQHDLYKKLIINAAKITLSYNKQAFGDLQQKLGITDAEIPSTAKQRHRLQAANDLLIKTLYQLTDEEWLHLISPAYFKVFNEKQAPYMTLLA